MEKTVERMADLAATVQLALAPQEDIAESEAVLQASVTAAVAGAGKQGSSQ